MKRCADQRNVEGHGARSVAQREAAAAHIAAGDARDVGGELDNAHGGDDSGAAAAAAADAADRYLSNTQSNSRQ